MKTPFLMTAALWTLLAALLALPGPARAVTNVTQYELTFDGMATGGVTGGDLTAAASGATWALNTGRGATYTISADGGGAGDQAFSADDTATINGDELFYTITLDTPITLDAATTVTISFRTVPIRSGPIKGLRFTVLDSSDTALGNVYWVDESGGDYVRLNGTSIGTSAFVNTPTWNSTSANIRSVTLTVTSSSLGVNFGGVTGSASHSRANVAKLRVHTSGSNTGAKGLHLADLKFTRTVYAPNAVASGASPADMATGVIVTVPSLAWNAPAVDSSHSAPTNYIVFFGTDSDVTNNPSYNTTSASLATPGSPLTANTTYYWRVDAQNEDGTTPGTSWQFTTGAGALPVIDVAASTFPESVSTTYGTASSSTSVSVSGTDLTDDITATAPTGLEVSNDDSTWGPTTTFTQSGGSASGTLYARLKNNAPVAGSYDSVNVVLSSPGATSVDVATTASGNTVSPKALNVVNVTALDKMYDGTTAGTVIGSLDTPEAFGEGNSADGRPYTGDALSLSSATGTFASSDIGTGISVTAGTFTLSGAAAGNYTLTQPTNSLTAAIRDTGVWTQPAGGSWTNINNWENGAVATGTNNTADFTTLSLTANRSVSLDGTRPIGNLWFADQSGSNFTWTIPSGGGPLTLAVNSGAPVISNSTFTTITVQLAGSQGFKKTGSATLRLNNTANPITGEILVSQGFLQIRDGTVNSPTVFAADTMDQRSLRTTGSGTTDLFRLGAANNTTVTWSMPALTLETGGTLRFRNDNANTINHNLDAALAVGTGGGKIVNSGTTGTGTQNVNLSGALSGDGALEYLANSGTARRLTIASANNTYSGDWTVAHTGTGTAFLRAGAANALGTGTVTLNAGATLENNAANGLDSLAGVTLNETTSTLDLSLNAWNNASATLTAKNGTNQLGAATSTVGTFVLDSAGTVTLNSSGGSLAASTFDLRQGTLAGTGALGGSGALTKSTAGTATLAGAHTYTGDTTVSEGTLELTGDGSIANSPVITVNSGATLKVSGVTGGFLLAGNQRLQGEGSIDGAVTVDGLLAPGASIGTLTLNDNLTLTSGSRTGVEVDRGASPNADRVTGIATFTAGGTLYVTNNGPALQINDEFTLFSASIYAGQFDSISPAHPNSDSGLLWDTKKLREEGKLRVHVAPTASDKSLTRSKGVSVKIKLTDLFPTTDPVDGDSNALNAFTHGTNGTVSTDGTYLLYAPTNDYGDVFTYTVSDGRGGTTTRNVTITVGHSVGSVILEHLGGGTYLVKLYGIPGYHYVVQRSCGDLESWADLSGDLTASPTGLVEYQDTPGEGCNPAFYRVRSN